MTVASGGRECKVLDIIILLRRRHRYWQEPVSLLEFSPAMDRSGSREGRLEEV